MRSAKRLVDADSGLLRGLVSGVVAARMGTEADDVCGADGGERKTGRTNSRNRVPRAAVGALGLGTIPLLISKLREDSWYPHSLLEPRPRVQGISKGQVSRLAAELDEPAKGLRTFPRRRVSTRPQGTVMVEPPPGSAMPDAPPPRGQARADLPIS